MAEADTYGDEDEAARRQLSSYNDLYGLREKEEAEAREARREKSKSIAKNQIAKYRKARGFPHTRDKHGAFRNSPRGGPPPLLPHVHRFPKLADLLLGIENRLRLLLLGQL